MNGLEWTLLHAGTALDTFCGINAVGLLDSTRDCSDRTASCAGCTALTPEVDDLVCEKILTYACRTPLILNVCDILVLEVTQS